MALKQKNMRDCNLFFSYSQPIDNYLSDKKAERVVKDELATPKLFHFILGEAEKKQFITYKEQSNTSGTLWELRDKMLIMQIVEQYSDRFSLSVGCVTSGDTIYNAYVLSNVYLG